jgi:hypothetical protein
MKFERFLHIDGSGRVAVSRRDENMREVHYGAYWPNAASRRRLERLVSYQRSALTFWEGNPTFTYRIRYQ